MPQPIRTDGFTYDPSPLSLSKNPSLAIDLAIALNTCSTLDVYLNWVIAKLLGPRGAKPGIAMYRRLESDSARFAVLRGAASAVLSKRDCDLFLALLGFVERVRSQRNKIAHNLWSVSDKYPESLIMRDSRDEAERAFASAAMHSSRNLYRDMDKLMKKHPNPQFSRWESRDFQAITDDATRVLQYLLSFWWVAEKSRTDSSTSRERARLRRVPEIRDALQREAAKRKRQKRT